MCSAEKQLLLSKISLGYSDSFHTTISYIYCKKNREIQLKKIFPATKISMQMSQQMSMHLESQTISDCIVQYSKNFFNMISIQKTS